MKVKQKKVYYCDFCGKHSLKNLSRHEKHCTLNPNRQCKLCGRASISEIIPKYKIETQKEWFTDHNSVLGETVVKIEKIAEAKLEQLKNEVEGCPNCILTVIRCNKYQWPIKMNFNYQEAIENWWHEKNEEERIKDEMSMLYDT